MKHTHRFIKAGHIISLLFLYPAIESHAQRKQYFQQDVKYEIHVSLDDKKHFLNGTVRIDYANNSPDTLHKIYFHLWPNAYRDNQTELAKQLEKFGYANVLRSKPAERGYVDSLNFLADNISVNHHLLTDTPDVCLLELTTPLPPGQKTEIVSSFRVKIPSTKLSRLGHIGQAYYITQWYLKPAVYDNNGWNYMPYLDKGEFYSEFGEYDVYITLPSNYVIASTGELLDSTEISWLDKKAAEDSPTVAKGEELVFPASSMQLKTVHFHAKDVHDFAWFADKRFHVSKGEATLASGKKIITRAYYTNNQPQYWKRAVSILNETVVKFSDWFGEYPYSSATAVDGLNAEGADMEYPMITLIGKKKNFTEFENTLAHEVSHFWFYGILGSNERKAGWMDEGWATFAKALYATGKQKDDELHPNYVKRYGMIEDFYNLTKLSINEAQQFVYRSGASINMDQPSNLDANQYHRLNYVADIYYKPAIGINHLLAFMGDSLFKKCTHAYFDQWKFRHPDGKAMQDVFESTSGRKLDWFFSDMIGTTLKTDYAIKKIQSAGENMYRITLRNKGGVTSPFLLNGYAKKNTAYSSWVDGFKVEKSVDVNCSNCNSFRIDADETLAEVNRQNNRIRTIGLCKKTKPVRFKFLGDVETTGKTTLFYTPALGYNSHDGLLTGGAIYNLSLIEKPLEFALMPMYGWTSKHLAGGGRVMYNLHTKGNFIQHVTLGVGASHYAYDEGVEDYYSDDLDPLHFTKLSADVIVDLRQKNRSFNAREYITLRNIFTATQRMEYTPCPTCDPMVNTITTDNRYFVFADYVKEKPVVFHPSSVKITGGLNKSFYRLSLEYNKTYSYAKRGKGFDFRFYTGLAGKVFHGPDDVYIDHRVHMSGLKGSDDFLYDGTFIDRVYDDVPQFISAEGGFKVPTSIGQSTWLMAINIKTVIHPVLPVKFYVNLGTYRDAADAFEGSQVVMYELGLEAYIIPGTIAIYFPLSYSKDIKNEIETNNRKFGDLIRFEFNLNKLSPFVMLKQKMRYGNF